MAQGEKREFTITRVWMNDFIHTDDHLPGHPLTNGVPLAPQGLGYYLCRLKRGRRSSFACSDSIIRCANSAAVEFYSITRRLLLQAGAHYIMVDRIFCNSLHPWMLACVCWSLHSRAVFGCLLHSSLLWLHLAIWFYFTGFLSFLSAQPIKDDLVFLAVVFSVLL